jgi:hypothetical protein
MPPPEIAVLLESHRVQNPGMHYQCFSRPQAADFIGEHLGPRHHAAFCQCAVPAMQADYFRYCAVLAKGGFYADADLRCVGPVESVLPGDAEAVLFHRGAGDAVVNMIFGCRHPRNALLAAVVEIATVNVETRLSNNVWVATGPGIFSVLHGIRDMTPAQRAALADGAVFKSNSSDPGPGGVSELDIARLIDVSYATITRLQLDIDALFADVAVRRFPQDATCCAEVGDIDYKATAVHWTNWPGTIFGA